LSSYHLKLSGYVVYTTLSSNCPSITMLWIYICISLLPQIVSWLAMPQVGDPFYPGEWADTDDVYEESDNVLTDYFIFVLGTFAIRLTIAAITHLYHAHSITRLQAAKAWKRCLSRGSTIIIKDPAACIAAVYALPESRPAPPLATSIPSELWNNVLTRPLARSRRRSASAPAALAPSSPASFVSPTISPTASISPERNEVSTEPFWHQLAGLPTAASAASSPPPPTPGPIAGGPPPPAQRNAGFTTPGAPSNPIMAEFYHQYPKTGTKRA